LTFLLDPAVRRLEKIIKHGEDAQALAAIKVVLDRNELYAFGVEPPARGACPPAVMVQTHLNLPEARVTEMSDADLEAYDRLLTELRELLAKDEPKRIGGGSL
jgi:hypothetical protein